MSSNESRQPHLDILTLPDISKSDMDLVDSSFFQSDDSPKRELPTPASILEKGGDQGVSVIKIPDLNIAVKIDQATYLRLEEAQTMCAMRQMFPNGEIPVPEVFGWRRYNGQVFIYMSLIHGETLRVAWPSLTEDNKLSIQSDLRQIIMRLRRITQDAPPVIASVNRGTVQDRFFKTDYEAGPFFNIKSFNDWVFAAATRQRPGPEGISGLDLPEMYRNLLPDTGSVYFTHGDLTLGNIMVSKKSGYQTIEAIIDWEQAGWYPEYWEYGKMCYGVEVSHEWRTEDWPDKIVEPFEDAWFAMAEYYVWRCP
ncbi:hypothetical protein AAFC00_004897 [Neodothiora populina]|uniref:Aminoglycoside phosphotransferase domain-containing protein n=1 Tax=Neodothiora populina TaxID=2781224 RepID=A0ABR3P3V4_9PEZI